MKAAGADASGSGRNNPVSSTGPRRYEKETYMNAILSALLAAAEQFIADNAASIEHSVITDVESAVQSLLGTIGAVKPATIGAPSQTSPKK